MEPRELIRELKGADTQAEFAAKIGVNQSTVSKLLKGKRVGGRAVLTGLLKAYPERADDLLTVFFAASRAKRPGAMTTEEVIDGRDDLYRSGPVRAERNRRHMGASSQRRQPWLR